MIKELKKTGKIETTINVEMIQIKAKKLYIILI
jgi:hypothetical protein